MNSLHSSQEVDIEFQRTLCVFYSLTCAFDAYDTCALETYDMCAVIHVVVIAYWCDSVQCLAL